MEIQFHTMTLLFEQLGLNDDDQSIDDFIKSHEVREGERLYKAPFWSESQALFLKENIEEDADWCEIIDQLDARLRRH